MLRLFYLVPCLLLFFTSCGDKVESESYDPEGSTDTRTRPIDYQVRKTWRFGNGSLSVTNDFPGSRLNDFVRVNDTLYRAVITPENGPVNKSPWYAFAIWSDTPRDISVQLTYAEGYTHRYYPDLSSDMIHWSPIDSSRFENDTINQVTYMHLPVSPDTLYIGAQEILPSSVVYEFADSLSRLPGVTDTVIGFSTLGKPVPAIHAGKPDSGKTIVILGRQHPPETTGFLALQSFVRNLLNQDSLSTRFLENYHCIIIPMLNPDGVDLGHWRHSAGGIDLNRDWYSFNQPETSAVRDYITSIQTSTGTDILFAIDFHSTQEDLFYVFEKDRPTALTGFTHEWLDRMENRLGDYTADRIQTSGTSPVSTRWFFDSFNTEAVTYEVGDSSPRDRINQIGEAAAQSLMTGLLEKDR